MIEIEGLEHYFGGKGAAGTYQQIINLMPPHNFYGEFFLGSGKIMRKKKAAQYSLGCEINPKVYELWCGAPLPREFVIINWDAFKLLRALKRVKALFSPKKGLIYLDPPYTHEERKSNTRYEHELTPDQHDELLTLAQDLSSHFHVMISCYDSEKYQTILNGWNKHSFNSTTRRGVAIETVYFNYEVPTQLHDYRYLGDDFREREKHKRAKVNLMNKLERFDPRVRNALLEEIFNEYNYSKSTREIEARAKATELAAEA